ncbi:hypothetical protein AMR72_15135 [Flavobacterium psychrophilum]|nr:hypothetical protein AMR72_15135 [Flavobacterium psychrophilum]AOE53733.1 hypothetical protein ALW18_15125 [Flavobacterium psychrophilum]
MENSVDGSAAYHHIIIVLNGQVGLDLFDGEDGFQLLFNPGTVPQTTEIPLTIYYNLPILKYVRNIQAGNLGTVQDYFFATTEMFGISPEELFFEAIKVFLGDDENPVQTFVDGFNQNPNYSTYPPLVIPSTGEYYTDVLNLLAQLKDRSIDSSIYILENYVQQDNLSNAFDNMPVLFDRWLGNFSQANFINLFIPKVSVSIQALNLALTFPRTWLKPVDAQGNVIEDESVKSMLTYHVGSLTYHSEYGFEFAAADSFDLTPSQIGNTGLLLQINNLKFDLRTDKNIPEATADGRPVNFQGIYADLVAITLPKKWFNNVEVSTLRIAGRNLLIGSGGVSGTISLETLSGQPNDGNAYLNLKIGNWEVGFNYFDLTFKQNVITQSTVTGRLKIPKLKDSQGNDALVYLSGHFNEAGDFNLTASEPEGIPLNLFNFVTINFLTLELGREDDHFYIGTSCQIWFDNQIMAKLIGDQIIEIPQLRIYDNGTMEIIGGNGFIPLNISLSLGPIDMAVTGVHFGSTQLNYNGQMRKYNYWGFDGAISIDPLGVDVRGNGIKYYFTVDNDEYGGSGDSFIHIKTLEIDLVIPGTASPSTAIAIIHGMLALPDPGESPEYIGEISLKLPKAKIAGGAAMKLAPRYPAFVVDAFIDLPAPIPIGPLGIYGFRGLLGFRYVAEKEAVGLVSGVNTWYDYYVYPPKGIHVSKFSGPERTSNYTAPFSLGAGAVLGTSFDSGTVISVRAMLLLSLPTLFMVEGKASILSARLGLDDNREPPFFAFVAWGDNSIEMGMGANFKLPSSNGWILKIYAEVQAGFFFNSPSAWYVNFGTKQNPISADVLTIVTAQTYLMLSAQGIQAGARVQFDINKRFGPAKVHLYAYLEIGGFVSFERPQLGGYIAAGGGIDIDIWIIGISIKLSALFSAEAAKPFLLYAEVSFRACVKLGFVRVCKSFTVKLKWEKDTTVDRQPVAPLPFSTSQGSVNRTNELVKGIHMLTNEAFDLNYLGMGGPPAVSQITKVIPLDTFIEFKTVKGLLPGPISGKIGGYTFAPGNNVDLIPPQKVVRGGRELRQVKHRYSIEDIEIKAHNGSSWQPYHPFEAVVAANERPSVAGLRVGYWQIKEKQYDTIRILATTPFTYLEAGEPGWHIPEMYGITPSTLYCQEPLRTEDCANVLNKALGTIYYPPVQYIGNYINGAYFTLLYVPVYEVTGAEVSLDQSQYSEVTNATNAHGFAKSLTFKNDNGLVIILPAASVTVKLRLSTDAQGVTITYYRSIIEDTTSIVQYEIVYEEYKTTAELGSVIEYFNDDKAITKIIIKPDGSDLLAIQQIDEQIAVLFEYTYDKARGEVNITEPSDIKKYQELIRKKQELENKGCAKVKGDCKKDDKLCAFYEHMVGIFNDCFIYPVNKVDELLREQQCFNDFLKQLQVFDKENPQYRLILSMQELYETWVKSLEKLNQYLDRYPESGSDREIITLYYQFRDYTIAVLEHIKKLGNCDCDDNPKTRCTTSLQQICWLTLENHQYNLSIPGANAIAEDFQDMTAAVEQVAQPVWRPNTSYYIRFRLKDEVDNGESNPGIFDYYYGFKTVGPVGHYHKNPASGYLPPGAKADEYPLTSLRSYIDYERSYPNADGNLLKAKPLFYGHQQCKISIYFDKPSTYHMFQLWHSYNNMPELDGNLHIAVKDPVTDVIVPYPLPVGYHEATVPIPDGSDVWHDDNDPLLPPHIQMLNNIIEHAQLPCQIDLGDPLIPASSFYSVTLTNLRPLKLYTALLYNAFEVTNNNIVSEPVHEFVFQTSRYENFNAQVNSYIITDEQAEAETQAVYQIDIDLNAAAVNKAWSIISDPAAQSSDPLGVQYQHLFDRVIEGVFEMLPGDPPARTEFHKLVSKATGDIVAVLIKNPEPFNNPKIPLGNLGAMIGVATGSGSTDPAYKALFSKDYSQALIMNTAKKITAPSLNFRFIYYTWNGSSYQETDNILVESININQ